MVTVHAHERAGEGESVIVATLCVNDDGTHSIEGKANRFPLQRPMIDPAARERVRFEDDPARWAHLAPRNLSNGYVRLVLEVAVKQHPRSSAAHGATGRGKVELVTRAIAAAIAKVQPDTFSSYVSRGRAPQPVTSRQGKKLWDAQEVRRWQQSRPRSAGKHTATKVAAK